MIQHIGQRIRQQIRQRIRQHVRYISIGVAAAVIVATAAATASAATRTWDGGSPFNTRKAGNRRRLALASQLPQLRREPQHQRAMKLFGILLARARRRAAARQQLTPDNLTNERRSLADQEIAEPRARVFLVRRIEERQYERIHL